MPRGRKPQFEDGLAPGLFVRLPHLQSYQLRALVRSGRPLGVVARELMMAGLAAELAKQEDDKAKRAAFRAQERRKGEPNDERGAAVDGTPG